LKQAKLNQSGETQSNYSPVIKFHGENLAIQLNLPKTESVKQIGAILESIKNSIL
jgi:hypothetical protein